MIYNEGKILLVYERGTRKELGVLVMNELIEHYDETAQICSVCNIYRSIQFVYSVNRRL